MNVLRRYKTTLNPKISIWQLVDPDNHRVNAAKQAIQMFKNNFIAGLATIYVTFPLQLWCYILVHAKLTLNII